MVLEFSFRPLGFPKFRENWKLHNVIRFAWKVLRTSSLRTPSTHLSPPVFRVKWLRIIVGWPVNCRASRPLPSFYPRTLPTDRPRSAMLIVRWWKRFEFASKNCEIKQCKITFCDTHTEIFGSIRIETNPAGHFGSPDQCFENRFNRTGPFHRPKELIVARKYTCWLNNCEKNAIMVPVLDKISGGSRGQESSV